MRPSWSGYPYLASRFGPPAEGQEAPPPPPHFVAECFFITSQLMHTCVIPAGADCQPARRALTAPVHRRCTHPMCFRQRPRRSQTSFVFVASLHQGEYKEGRCRCLCTRGCRFLFRLHQATVRTRTATSRCLDSSSDCCVQ